MEIKDEVAEMNKSLDVSAKVEEKKEEPPPPEEKKEEAKVEDKKEEKKEEKVEEKKEEKAEEKKEEVVDPKDKEITELKAQLELLKASAAKPPEKKEEVKEEKKVEKKEETLTEEDFLKDIDLDELTRDSKEMNKVLNQVVKVANKRIADMRSGIIEEVFKSIPDIVGNNIKIITQLEETKKAFYKENPDLEPFSKVVGVVFEEVLAKNTDKKLEEVLALVATDVRTRLNLAKQAKEEEKKEGRKAPKLPSGGGKGGRGDNAPSVEGIEAEIEAMNKAV